MNYYGQLGVHKTQSAQTLGHGRFGIGLFLEGASLYSLVDSQKFCANKVSDGDNCSNPLEINGDYIGLNAYPFLSFGLSDYFDFSIGIPIYGDILTLEDTEGDTDNYGAGGWGDLFISTKLRAPFDDNFPLDVALSFGIGLGTSRKNNGSINAYGPWVRDPMFLNTDTETTTPIWAKDSKRSTYSNGNPFMKIGLATTLDFGRIKTEIPVLFHLNGAYKTPMGSDSENYSKIMSFSTALEVIPVEFLSIYGEFYRDFPLDGPASSISLSTTSFGTAFHLGKTVDLQLGVQIFVGDKDYIEDLTINTNVDPNRYSYYRGRLIPNYVTFGGLTVKFSTIEPKKEEVKETRNPDTDGDKVCDPWVAESSKQSEYSSECRGIDLCPYEQGALKDKGCPVEEVKAEAPGIIFTAAPDVVQKGQSVTLTWQVTNATSVSIEDIGDVAASGSKKVKPEKNTTYTLTAVGEGGTQTVSTEVEVTSGPPPVVLFSAAPLSVQAGQPVTLTWQVTNATEVDIEGIGRVPFKGTRQVKPTESTVFKLTATGEGGKLTEAISIEVTPVPVIEARVNLQGVTFGSGNATLTANAKKILDGVAEQLVANPNVKIEIQGHTDSQGKPAANKDLSERRAKAVVAYLATKGVKMSRMRAVGYGQDVPIADNSTPDGRELNRRIEMVRIDD